MSLFRFARTVILISLLIGSATAVANDSTAELAAGGLVLTKSDSVEMLSEDLFLSMQKVRVQYHFYNHADRDVVTQVAFPIPDIQFGTDLDFAIPGSTQNILPFATTVNGRPVAINVERRAILNGLDRTDVLKRLGISPAPEPSTEPLSQQTLDELVKLGLAEESPDRQLQPRWTLKTTYYWEQIFPAHQEIVVDHSYLPSVGSVVPLPASSFLSDPEPIGLDRTKGSNKFCVDQSFISAVAKPHSYWQPHYLQYVLTTGANWSGPIKQFRLVVDKGDPDNLVSFCASGVRKIGSTQFEIDASMFSPASDLSILILTPDRSEDFAAPEAAGKSTIVSNDLSVLNCDQLWYRRNSIFKSNGYCFRTPRGINAFGNAGCRYDDQRILPLSDQDRAAVIEIQQFERAKQCH